jgi:hypothetical protein
VFGGSGMRTMTFSPVTLLYCAFTLTLICAGEKYYSI